MKPLLPFASACASLLVSAALAANSAPKKKAVDPTPELPPATATQIWEPVPPVIGAPAGGVPSDALVLFDGRNLEAWKSAKTPAGPAPWKLEGDAMVCVPKGHTPNRGYPAYKAHADRLPLLLQDHNNLIAFRNIWVRELKLPATP